MSPLKMAPSKAPPPGRRYWRSLDELAGNPEFRRFVENEFPAYADEMLAPASRRTFLKIMGASLAMAGMTACRWPREEILPFAHRPEEYVPGEPLHYATAMELGGVASGLVVTSYDGRPIKIEGNPEHPASRGATSALAQAAILELYDPDRSKFPVRGDGVAATWDDVDGFFREHFSVLRASRGRGLRVLSEASDSPSLAAMRHRWQQAFPEARWDVWEALGRDGEREGTRAAFGAPHRPQLELSTAEVIVSLGSDFLYDHPDAVRLARDFVDGRSVDGGSFSRLHVVEASFSLTGTMADHRIPVKASEMTAVAGALAARLVSEHGVVLSPASLSATVRRFGSHPVSARLAALAGDLASHRGSGLVVAGPGQPAEVHALVAAINEALGNVGHTVSYVEDDDRRDGVSALAALTDELEGGRVDTLVLVGGNPVYDAPADLAFGDRIPRAGTSIHLSLHCNETSRACTWHVPRAHFLESWGDSRDWRGRISLVQPLIEPLFSGWTPVEFVAAMVGEAPSSGHEIVRQAFEERGGDDAGWRRALHDGIVGGSEYPLVTPTVRAGAWAQALAAATSGDGSDAIEVVFAAGSGVYDGRFGNNGWLQELPDPLTKLTWDNAALVSPATAKRLSAGQGDVVAIDVGAGPPVELPVFIAPGQAEGTIGVALGYGRAAAGRVGDGVGVDVYPLRTSTGMQFANATVRPSGRSYPLATTQSHYAIDTMGADERARRAHELVREFDLREMPGAGHAGGDAEGHGDEGDHGGAHVVNLWKQFEYEGHKWGMAIDLNACTGCNSCVVACQSENNIPVVGKDEVSRGRYMHWIRIDRYFVGDPAEPEVAHQPLTCHHCENAPCEQVCPVAATVHDHEGLNVMVYNRCIGTRYCSNNCPYKVRRFNYFNNHKNESDLEKMAHNPEVTVRSRGVMEKCTFCVQRINRVKIKAKNGRRPIEDGEIMPACAQACPTRAISFGDLNDGESRVHDDFADPRAYSLLEWLYVKPRTRYLARVRNRHDSHEAQQGKV